MKKIILMSLLIVNYYSFTMNRMVNRFSKSRNRIFLKNLNFKRNICSRSDCRAKPSSPYYPDSVDHLFFAAGFVSIPTFVWWACNKIS